MNTSYRAFIAAKIRENSDFLAQQWLDSLKSIVLEDARDIFPTEQYLDHIPEMIREIGKIIQENDTQLALINSLITRKALELGTLRHEQEATVSQLLREYDLLAQHLEDYVIGVSEEFEGALAPKDMTNTCNTIHAIVRRVLQDTVDSFVSRYVETIEGQTEKLLHFNHFIGHEIRTPLQTALLNIELVLDDASHPPDVSATLNDVQSAIEKVIDIMNNVDTLLNPTDDVVADTPVTQEIGLIEMITDIAEQLKQTLSSRQVRLALPANPSTITTDTGKLRLILTNLLSNAIKYSDPEKEDSFVSVSSDTSNTESVTITIEDNGIGISPGLLPRVTELKVRAYEDKDHSTPVKGHGIGLYLVDEAVKFIGGRMDIESVENVGTTVILHLPNRL